MIKELIKEYEKLEKARDILWMLVFRYNVQDNLPREANNIIDAYFQLDQDE